MGFSALHFASDSWIATIFSSLCGSRIRSVGAALRHTSPAAGNHRRMVEACSGQPVTSRIFIARSSVLQRPTDQRAQQSVRATSLTRSPRCNISIAVSLRAWFLSRVLWIVLCIRRLSVQGIGAMIGIAQSG